ncbi:MAG: DUF1836 domain-containing protein [Oscillospiraceae bacterium]|jgi:DNA-binding transcriptional MerR regulator|nr:DUF1836 domain-containing protein [Oscillospiraceae bacterium]
MLEVKDEALPGTAKTYANQGEKGFAKIEMLLEATGGLSLSQVCAVTGLEGSTIQNWVKRGWVEHPRGKKYEEIHIARILIINALKECIKLEHIAKLMGYVNGKEQDGSEAIIRESQLYNYLCEALKQSGQADDHSKGGVEGVVDRVISDYSDPNPNSKVRIRKALTVMIFACVCTDVKRRTEAMMGQILKEIDTPKPSTVNILPKMEIPKPSPVVEVQAPEPIQAPVSTPVVATTAPVPTPVAPPKQFTITLEDPIEPEPIENVIETRKTVSQALREWDISSVEKIIIDHNEETRSDTASSDERKPAAKPWYARKK